MSNLVEIPVGDLLRVTPFMATNDVRHYLNGVLVEPYKGHALLVATNGHWMAIYESEAARVDKPRILDLPRWFVAQVEKISRGESLDDAPEDLDDEEDPPCSPAEPKTLTISDQSAHLKIIEPGQEWLVKPGKAFVEGKFPDWRKVLPDPSTLERGLFSPVAVQYLSALHRAVPNEREHPLFCYQQPNDPAKPIVFRFGNLPNLVIVLMPRKDFDKEPKEWPEWMKAQAKS